MNRRIVAAVAAVLLASLGTFVLVAYVRGADDRALAGERTVDVLVVSKAIDRGTSAEQLEGRVALQPVPVKVQAEGSVSDIDDLAGKVAAVDLVPGEQLLASRFVDPATATEQAGVAVPDGLQQVTLSLEPQKAFGGRLRPGDLVGVAATVDQNGSQATHLMLNEVLVTDVLGEPEPADPAVDNGAAADRPAAPGGNFLVTLAVNAGDAERLVFAATNGSIWLTAQGEDTNNNGARVWTSETIFQ